MTERVGLDKWDSAQLPPVWDVLLKGLPIEHKTCVVDVGANPNVSAPLYLPLLRAGGCDVVGFEPQSGAYNDLIASKSEHEIYYQLAVGDGSTKALHVYAQDGFTSVFPAHMPSQKTLAMKNWTTVRQLISFDTVRLDDVPDFPRVDLLKIDIQGGELEVFRGAEKTLKDAVAVIVELRYSRLYAGEPMLHGVDGELSRQGFCIHKLVGTKSRPFRNSQMEKLRRRRVSDQLLDGDAVYIRNPETIADWNDQQVSHMAVLASVVFESHSLALFCLDELVRRDKVSAELPPLYVAAMPSHLLA